MSRSGWGTAYSDWPRLACGERALQEVCHINWRRKMSPECNWSGPPPWRMRRSQPLNRLHSSASVQVPCPRHHSARAMTNATHNAPRCTTPWAHRSCWQIERSTTRYYMQDKTGLSNELSATPPDLRRSSPPSTSAPTGRPHPWCPRRRSRRRL